MLPIIMQLGSFLSPKVSEFGSTAPPFIAGGGGEERWNTLFATKTERKCYLHFIPNRKGLNFTKLCCLGAVFKWRHHFRRVSLQTTHVNWEYIVYYQYSGGLKWKPWIPSENDDNIYEHEQPHTSPPVFCFTFQPRFYEMLLILRYVKNRKPEDRVGRWWRGWWRRGCARRRGSWPTATPSRCQDIPPLPLVGHGRAVLFGFWLSLRRRVWYDLKIRLFFFSLALLC